MKFRTVFSFLFVICPLLFAQLTHETRAVWLATNFRLDWPPPVYDEEKQKKALTEILDDLIQKNFNTVYFQVFFNGTTMYKSQLAPMSYYITGVIDDSTAYDPLKFAIEECHKRGIEIHAWINALRCFTGTENFVRQHQKHVMSMHKDWVVEKFIDGQNTYWLDPGLPQVRNYVANIAEEIVNNYDIDGLQLDFLRYPSNDFSDEKSYRAYGKNSKRDDWRRGNINQIVEKIHEFIEEEKPSVKFGITPIGIYKNQNNASGLQGFENVYQNTRLWLKNGWIDYAVPQIYWSFDDNPKFDLLAKEWQENSAGRNIVLGIAAYKNDVVNEIDRMIEYSRIIGSAGVAFFRYSNIKDIQILPFQKKSFPAKMKWKDNQPPDEISDLYAETDIENDKFKLSWKLPDSLQTSGDIFYTAVYKLHKQDEKLSSDNLFRITKASNESIKFSISNPSNLNYFFAVKTLDRFWNESIVRSNTVKYTIPSLQKIIECYNNSNKPIFIKNSDGEIFALVYSKTNRQIKFNYKEIMKTEIKNLTAGINLIKLENNIRLDSIEILYP